MAETRSPDYARDGFVVSPDPVLPPAVVDAARQGMAQVRAGVYDTGESPQPSPWNPGDPDDVLCKIEMPQLANRAIRALTCHPALGARVAAATGWSSAQVWWVQLLHKPSTPATADRVRVGWHQDRQYWSVWEAGSPLCTAWVALDDVGPRSGPMRFVCGSHRWGRLEGGDFFGQDLDGQRQALRPPAGEAWHEEAALMAAGGLSVHDALTLHASGANTSGRARLSLAIHMCGPGAQPVGGRREGLAAFLDRADVCPTFVS